MQKNNRILSLDLLRGFGILVMFIDHYFGIAFNMEIGYYNVRFFTRIAEPIFALLLGFFLYNRHVKSLILRFIEILIVAAIINVFFYSVTHKFEVLGSFLIVYVIYLLSSTIQFPFVFFLFAILINNFDFTINFLDYPLSIVLYQVALGYSFRILFEKQRIQDLDNIVFALLIVSHLLLGFYFVQNESYKLTVYFTGIAAILVILTLKFNDYVQKKILFASKGKLSALQKSFMAFVIAIGQRPLFFYAIQYALAVLLAFITWGLIGGKNFLFFSYCVSVFCP